jgi:hypothetical protein
MSEKVKAIKEAIKNKTYDLDAAIKEPLIKLLRIPKFSCGDNYGIHFKT